MSGQSINQPINQSINQLITPYQWQTKKCKKGKSRKGKNEQEQQQAKKTSGSKSGSDLGLWRKNPWPHAHLSTWEGPWQPPWLFWGWCPHIEAWWVPEKKHSSWRIPQETHPQGGVFWKRTTSQYEPPVMAWYHWGVNTTNYKSVFTAYPYCWNEPTF